MPFVNIKVAGKLSKKQKSDIVLQITKTMEKYLNVWLIMVYLLVFLPLSNIRISLAPWIIPKVKINV